MGTRNLTYRLASPAGLSVLALLLALAGVALAQQAGTQAPPEPPWISRPRARAGRTRTALPGVLSKLW